jgi:polysaccharide chain length determinant protein (PEP-CTERM system associated)
LAVDDYQSSEGFGGQLIQYAEAPARRPLAVLIPLVLVVAGSVVAGRLTPERYKSGTLILVESEKVPARFADRVATESTGSRLQTITQEIMSRTRLEKVIRELNPFPQMKSLANAVDVMRASIILYVKGNDAFWIEFSHTDPKMAMDVANRLASQFIEEAGKARAAQVGEANAFIEAQLEEARKALEAKETEMRRFKEGHMGRLPEQLSANLATLQRLQGDKQSVEASLRAAEERLEQLQKAAESGEADASGSAETPAALRTQLTNLRARYTDEHPDVVALVKRIEELSQRREEARDAAMGEGVNPGLVRAQEQVDQLRVRRERLGQQLDDFQARVDQVPRTEQEESTLTRDYSKLRENYQTMLNKKMSADMGLAIEARWQGEQFRILDPAYLPDKPYAPNRQMFVLVGILAGLGLGLVTALVLEFIDPSIKSVADLEGVVPFPVLATLPRVKPARRARAKADARRRKRSA